MNNTTKGLIVILILIVLIFGVSKFSAIKEIGKTYLGVIEIKGILADASDYVSQIEKMRKDDKVKGVLIRIDSPGGGVVVAQEIYEAVKRLKSEKPVVISMGSAAASGGYYIACAGDIIYANPGTITGSIGVIMEYPEIEELMKKIGIKQVVIKTGKRKDSGNMYRKITPEERKYFQHIINKLLEDFKLTVITERKLENPPDSMFDGRVFTGREAQELGLVDSIGDKHSAGECLKSLCNIKGEANWYSIRKKKSFLSSLLDYADTKSSVPFVYYLMRI